MNFPKKRKPHYTAKNYKRAKDFRLKPGLKGFICTCNSREKECIREAYNILNEYADILFGEENQKPGEDDAKSSHEKEDSSEEDIDTALNKELDTLKAEKKKAPTMRRFQVVESGANNFIFIQTNLDEPVKLVHHIMKDLKDSKKQRTRFLLRLIPVEATCKAQVEDIRIAADGLFDKYFTEEGKTFSVLFNRRNNSSITRDEVIPELAEMVLRRHPDNKADLKHPQLAVLVEIIRGNCCISVIPEYFEFRKYNLLEICSSENATAEVEANDDDDVKIDKKEKANDDIKINEKEILTAEDECVSNAVVEAKDDDMKIDKKEKANDDIKINEKEILMAEDECVSNAPATERESTDKT